MLPDDPTLYFEMTPETVLLPLASLEPIRAREKGIKNAEIRMALAACGLGPRRAPIDVEAIDGARYRIIDGNSTFAVARRHGFAFIACIVK